MNTLLNLESSKKLKLKGYNEPVIYGYGLDEKFHFDTVRYKNNYNDSEAYPYIICSIPTIGEVRMWFFEKYGIWIETNKEFFCGEFIGFVIVIDGKKNEHIYKTPIEAYSYGINYVLENLL